MKISYSIHVKGCFSDYLVKTIQIKVKCPELRFLHSCHSSRVCVQGFQQSRITFSDLAFQKLPKEKTPIYITIGYTTNKFKRFRKSEVIEVLNEIANPSFNSTRYLINIQTIDGQSLFNSGRPILITKDDLYKKDCIITSKDIKGTQSFLNYLLKKEEEQNKKV